MFRTAYSSITIIISYSFILFAFRRCSFLSAIPTFDSIPVLLITLINRIFCPSCFYSWTAMAPHISPRSALLAAQYPVLDFLAPRLIHTPRTRFLSTTTVSRAATQSISKSQSPPQSSSQTNSNESKKPPRPLSKAHRDFLDSAVSIIQFRTKEHH